MAAGKYIVSRAEAGATVGEWLRRRLALPRPAGLRLLQGRLVFLDGKPCLDPLRRLRPGQRLEVRAPARPSAKPSPQQPHAVSTPFHVVFIDDDVVVVDKPAGLTTMRHASEAAEFGRRAQRFLPPTLADLLPATLPGKRSLVRPVHRIDNETSGLVVFARHAAAESSLGKQFRAHAVERTYLALVRGRARDATIESWLVRDRGDGRRGSGPTGQGQRAVTHVRVVEELGDFTLLECRLETGRTHQVRIHLGEAGTPLCGERVYDRPPHGQAAADGSGAKRILLHAAVLGFDHPTTGDAVRWTASPPRDVADLLKRLRRLRDGQT
jgi:23S rRNA pseudouridine1911/1915/1917 synthase